MILFNELRITPDNKCLIIDVYIDSSEYFEGVKIDTILIDTHETFIENGPSADAFEVYSQELKAMDLIKDPKGQHVRIELTKPMLDPGKNTMFFVYVRADISEAPYINESPCGCVPELVLGTAINDYMLYNTLMLGIKDLSNDCSIHKDFIDVFLRLLGVDAALRAGKYPVAIDLWKKFFVGEYKRKRNPKPCGCYGRT